MIIYWCDVDLHGAYMSMTGLRRASPYPVKNVLSGKYNVKENTTAEEMYFRCPAHIDHLKNLFVVPATFDCDLIIDKQKDQPDFATSTFVRDNHDFNRAFLIRSIKNRLFSLNLSTLFLVESDDLLVSQMPAYLESNGFVDNTVIVPGTFNIGKWPRILECAFHLKEDKMFLREGEPTYYIKFHTNEKVFLKEFLYTPKMKEYVNYLFASKNYKGDKTKMQYFYDVISRKKGYKKRMLEEAAANVIGE